MAISRDALALIGQDTSLRWNAGTPLGTPTVVTYAFSTKQPGYDTEKRSGFTAFGEEHKKHARAALDLWAEAGGLTFVEVPQNKGGQIRFAMENMIGRESSGFAYYPWPEYEYNEAGRKWVPSPGFKGDNVGGDVFLLASDYAKDPGAIAPGPWSWLLVHEIGHALGFKHPFEGTPKLKASLDNVANTVLSYTYDAGYRGGIGPLDKQAVQYYYGNKSFDVRFNSKTLKVDIRATDRGEHLLGTELSDVLRGLGGNDTVRAGPGHDRVLAGNGNDRVYGGEGDDSLHGEAGGDRLFGDEGRDSLFGGAGNDYLYGGPGNDILRGGAGNDRLYGDEGRDTLHGEAGSDLLFGGAANDVLYGGSGNDRLYGGDGNDRVYGGAGNDRIFGDDGHDRLVGDAGHDLLFGGDGKDLLYGITGQDRLYGGAGNDRLFGGADNDRLYGDAGRDMLSGDAGNDLLFGGRDADSLYGGAGDDRLYGGDGNDRLYGGNGSDRFYGGQGNDVIHGGAGVDYAYFGSRQDDYLISTSGGVTVVRHVGGQRADGVDKLLAVEYLVFSDGLIAV